PLAVAHQLQAQPAVAAVRAVAQQRHRPGVVTEGQVGLAVVVVVGPGQAAPHPPLPEIAPRPGRHVPEPAPALAQEELRLLGEGRPGVLGVAVEVALATAMASRPSRVASRNTVPKPSRWKLAGLRPEGQLQSWNS